MAAAKFSDIVYAKALIDILGTLVPAFRPQPLIQVRSVFVVRSDGDPAVHAGRLKQCIGTDAPTAVLLLHDDPLYICARVAVHDRHRADRRIIGYDLIPV